MRRNRSRPTPQQLTTLVQLLKLGAAGSHVQVSSSRLGEALGISQQAASKRLIELERGGLVERAHSGRGLAVRLTGAGLSLGGSFYADLRGAMETGERELVFRGYVFAGLKEGGYYVSLSGYSKPFLDALGFVPYPGTLNLRLTAEAMVEQRRRLRFAKGIEVPGFEDGKRAYGPVKCFKARVGKYQAGVLAIERTHYDDTVLEAVAPVNLRRALRLKEGDECSVEVYLD
jgi:riboflavin kinase, archaea type